jgi:hypothetical protein
VAQQFKITTTGTQDPVVFIDLGERIFNHPTVNFDLYTEFYPEEIIASDDVQAAITNGWITVIDETGSNIIDVATQAAEPANLTPFNKGMSAITTGADNSLACSTAIFATPPANAWIQVYVNGISYKVGNGTKASVPCYFSGDGGITARATGAIVTGDSLYWNGSIAGFQLDSSDRIDFVFEAQ